jgi:OmcA/MtrC family decaheme c-type cytochrome
MSFILKAFCSSREATMNARWKMLLAAGAFAIVFSLAGCEGDDGRDGAAGADGATGADGLACWDLNGDGMGNLPDEDLNEDGMVDVLDCNPLANDVAAAVAEAEVEACATCHGGVGEEHTAIYDSYVDESTLALTLNSVASVADGAGGFDVTLDISITQDGQPFVDGDGLPSLEQKRFYMVQYDSAAGEYLNGNQRLRTIVAGALPGDYVVTQSGMPFAPEGPWDPPFDGAHVYGYIAQGVLLEHEGGTGAELPEGTHVHLYDDVANAALAFGTADAADPNAYESTANVAGCEKCHGVPYLKHGFRDPIVADLPDFASCKSCHYDDRDGGHEDWQYMVDEPLNWATAARPESTVEMKYAYKARIMNDVHMAHGMEFPYPQSMSTCNTCHEGKLDDVLANTNFTPETCKSCHPVQGRDAWPAYELADGTEIDAEEYAQPHRAPPLEFLWTEAGVDAIHNIDLDCQACHGAGVSRAFNEYHTGYDVTIYNAAGERYADLFSVSIDNISLDGDEMTIEYSASDAAIVPELLVSFYGWDSKNYIVPSHARDGTDRCIDFRGNPNGCDLEIAPGGTNPVFTSLEEVAAGSWVATLDMTQWIDGQPGFIPDLIADGTIKKAEVTITPEFELTVPGHDHEVEVVLNAVGQTVDVNTGALVADYFKRDNAIVLTEKCDVCHDSLASSFHDGSGRGGGGIQVCKNCHNPTFPGSHIEMASRSIDNYVHSIHSFQDFDLAGRSGWTFEAFDPVDSKRYDQHINHVFPRFTIRNCEACHVEAGATGPDGGTYPVVYDVPDQSQSIPGVLSVSAPVKTWYEMMEVDNIPDSIAVEVPEGRNIGSEPERVTGPASRACGACHRARLINQEEGGALASFNAHTKAGGTYVENDAANDPPDQVLFGVIDKIMTLFE